MPGYSIQHTKPAWFFLLLLAYNKVGLPERVLSGAVSCLLATRSKPKTTNWCAGHLIEPVGSSTHLTRCSLPNYVTAVHWDSITLRLVAAPGCCHRGKWSNPIESPDPYHRWAHADISCPIHTSDTWVPRLYTGASDDLLLFWRAIGTPHRNWSLTVPAAGTAIAGMRSKTSH